MNTKRKLSIAITLSLLSYATVGFAADQSAISTVTTSGGAYNSIIITNSTSTNASMTGVLGTASTPTHISLTGDKNITLKKIVEKEHITDVGNYSLYGVNYGILDTSASSPTSITVNNSVTMNNSTWSINNSYAKYNNAFTYGIKDSTVNGNTNVTNTNSWDISAGSSTATGASNAYAYVSASTYSIINSTIDGNAKVNIANTYVLKGGSISAATSDAANTYATINPTVYGINLSTIEGSADINITSRGSLTGGASTASDGTSAMAYANAPISVYGVTDSLIKGDANLKVYNDFTLTGGTASITSPATAYANARAEASAHVYGIQNSTINGNANVDITNKWTLTGGSASAPATVTVYAKANSPINSIQSSIINGNAKVNITNDWSPTGGSSSASGSINSYAEPIITSYGIMNSTVSGDTSVTINSKVKASAPSGTISDNSQNAAIGIFGTSKLDGNVDINLNTDTTDGIYFYSRSLMTNNVNHILDLSSTGKIKTLVGDVSAAAGNILLNLDTSNSYLQGNVVTDGAGIVDFTVANGAEWRPIFDNRYGTDSLKTFDASINNKLATVSSRSIDQITLADNGTINMAWDGSSANSDYPIYTSLTIGDFTSNNGHFIMNTDLASDITGDKVTIDTSNVGTTSISVSDASLKNNTYVTGTHKLLLVTDTMKNITFIGSDLNSGGLWTTTPTIENGVNVDGGAAEEWYLTMITKKLNEDTQVLQDASRNQYALWQTSNDTYRERKSALRDELDKDNGIWARYKGGSLDSNHKNNNYNIFQLGYDKAVTNQWTIGASLERAQGNADYSFGSGKDKMWAGSLYGTWAPTKDSYTDIVLKYGEINSDIHSYGEYPDNASYSTKGYSLGVEH